MCAQRAKQIAMRKLLVTNLTETEGKNINHIKPVDLPTKASYFDRNQTRKLSGNICQ